MFTKILIANRGEIAIRVARTARRLGVATVAVYSDADADAAHVAACDQAVHIGGSAPADSYLRGDAIIKAAHATGAQAIHPGYGFLSENPEFAQACVAKGLVFIGPSADAMRAMGLKGAAKSAMQAAGVPVVPGYHGDDQTPDRLAQEARAIGYPVLIKAVAGGGGKGMRQVARAEDFAQALQSAVREAQGAFGNPRVLIEKYIEQPRHIEVQIFGDGSRAVHLFERDCSLQRRHQKVIEEAPAPDMPVAMRAAMGAAAVRAAQAIDYAGAGTVEFIVDGAQGLREDGFWFMEMNTRLQVEHPVTEAITGVDLVEWQLRVAAGEPLPARQEDLQITGHAFEARLYAEDVDAGFLPATGRLDVLRFATDARVEAGVAEGDAIAPFYDPMIAKIITHGPTRDVALSRLAAALDATHVGGSITNLAFLRKLSRHAGFAAAQVDTGLIARDLAQLVGTPAPDETAVAIACLAALGLHGAPAPAQGFALWAPLWHPVQLRAPDGTLVAAQVALRTDDSARVRWEGGDITLIWRDGREGFAAGNWHGIRPAPAVVRRGDRIYVLGQGDWAFTHVDPLDRQDTSAASASIIEAPMPGLLRALFVSAGDTVEKGARLAVLEAMKMEHTLNAARDGTIAEVLVAQGDQVSAQAPLIRFEDIEEEETK